MPTYTYLCKTCEHKFEHVKRMTEPDLKECPRCHEETLSQVISPSTFQLKGTGWYETDFKHKGKS